MSYTKDFEKIFYIKNFIESFDVSYTNLGGYHFNKDKQPCYYLNGALQMYEMKHREVEIMDKLLSEALEKLYKYEKTKSTDDLESLRWTLESLQFDRNKGELTMSFEIVKINGVKNNMKYDQITKFYSDDGTIEGKSLIPVVDE